VSEPSEPTEPTDETFAAILRNQGLSLSEERLAHAVAAHAAMRPELDALRAVPLSFLEPVLEPGTALQWIERGGSPT
jgi:hypothetical protein